VPREVLPARGAGGLSVSVPPRCAVSGPLERVRLTARTRRVVSGRTFARPGQAWDDTPWACPIAQALSCSAWPPDPSSSGAPAGSRRSTPSG